MFVKKMKYKDFNDLEKKYIGNGYSNAGTGYIHDSIGFFLRKRKLVFFTMYDNNKIVGIVGVYINKKDCFVDFVFVNEELRCKGIGNDLLKEVIKTYSSLAIFTQINKNKVNLKKSMSFFKRAGFSFKQNIGREFVLFEKEGGLVI